MEPSPFALIGVLATIGIGTLSIAVALFMKMFRGPNDQHDDVLRVVAKLADKVEKHAEDQGNLSKNVAMLTVETNHLSKNVERLSTEMMYLRQGGGNGRSIRRAAAD
jgi:hypothetical protein